MNLKWRDTEVENVGTEYSHGQPVRNTIYFCGEVPGVPLLLGPGEHDLLLCCELYILLLTNIFLKKKKEEERNEGRKKEGREEFTHNFDLISPLLGFS